MKKLLAGLITILIFSCKPSGDCSNSLVGTWKLLSGTIIQKGDTTITDYTTDRSMVKVINATHFSFLNHDLNRGQDSTGFFSAGGGRYTLTGNNYKEYLEYCSDRQWERHEFEFTIEIKGDTLVQQGVEKIKDAGIERYNIEKYVRL